MRSLYVVVCGARQEEEVLDRLVERALEADAGLVRAEDEGRGRALGGLLRPGVHEGVGRRPDGPAVARRRRVDLALGVDGAHEQLVRPGQQVEELGGLRAGPEGLAVERALELGQRLVREEVEVRDRAQRLGRRARGDRRLRQEVDRPLELGRALVRDAVRAARADAEEVLALGELRVARAARAGAEGLLVERALEGRAGQVGREGEARARARCSARAASRVISVSGSVTSGGTSTIHSKLGGRLLDVAGTCWSTPPRRCGCPPTRRGSSPATCTGGTPRRRTSTG